VGIENEATANESRSPIFGRIPLFPKQRHHGILAQTKGQVFSIELRDGLGRPSGPWQPLCLDSISSTVLRSEHTVGLTARVEAYFAPQSSSDGVRPRGPKTRDLLMM